MEQEKDAIALVGCCGAYCKTCKEYTQNRCKGCKIGYDSGNRDIQKAKCAMKICCIRSGLASCADCETYNTCAILASFYAHASYKYKKYKQATQYIRINGYEPFLRLASRWSGAYDEPMPPT